MKKRLGAGLLCAVLLSAILCPCAMADEYTYTVTVYAGDKGSINGQDSVVLSGYRYGDDIDFSYIRDSVKLNEADVYYVKGVRESGHDNSEAGIFYKVTGDTDYVIAYGIRGEMVEYTVNYVDKEGKKLAESETLTGNVGDKPSVAYRHIDGYQPDAYIIKGTLTAEGPNVFDFIYTKISDITEVYYNEVYKPKVDENGNVTEDKERVQQAGEADVKPVKDIDDSEVALTEGIKDGKPPIGRYIAYALAGTAALAGAGFILFALLRKKEKQE